MKSGNLVRFASYLEDCVDYIGQSSCQAKMFKFQFVRSGHSKTISTVLFTDGERLTVLSARAVRGKKPGKVLYTGSRAKDSARASMCQWLQEIGKHVEDALWSDETY